MSGPLFNPLRGFQFPIPGILHPNLDEYLNNRDVEGGLHGTQREMWEANARIEEANRGVACNRELDNPPKGK